MRAEHIMAAVKGNLLDLWLEINKKEIDIPLYLKIIEELFKEQFEVNQLKYYFVQNEHLIWMSGNPAETDIIPVLPDANEMTTLLNEKTAASEDVNKYFIIRNEDQIETVLFFKTSEAWELFTKSDSIDEFGQVFNQTIQIMKKQITGQNENNLNEHLLQMTDALHATMDITSIIEAMVMEIESGFPKVHYKLILSNDLEGELPETVHVFDYVNESPATVKAFVSNEVTKEYMNVLKKVVLNIPIVGRQGTYGVIQLAMPQTVYFSETEMKKIIYLGDSAGKSLENAKLYHQSHRLIKDLQLINESSHRLNMNISQAEILSYISELMTESFKPSELAIVFLDEDGQADVKHGSTLFFLNGFSDRYLDFVVDHFTTNNSPIFIADFQLLVDEDIPYHSLMVVPMIMHEKVRGFVLVAHESSYYFSFESYKLIQSIIRHSSLAISNVLLREKLQMAVDRDHLTKLYARGYLDNYIEKAVKEDESGIFVLFDIDDFKKVNDQYGHQVGDQILKTASDIIKMIVSNEGICARWGGEELAVYFPNKSLRFVLGLATKMMTAVRINTEPSITLSTGISYWDRENLKCYDEIFKEADEALYEAKANGKNQSIVYNVKC